MADLQLELETVYLLRAPSESATNPTQVSGWPRRPDFAVTFTTHTIFMLEVTGCGERKRSVGPGKPARDRRAFFHHYGRLGEVLVCGLPRRAGNAVWLNPQAKHPPSSKVRAAPYRSQAG